MATRDQELQSFKTDINLTEYAASQGYALDRKESSRNSVVMRGPSNDKIVVTVNGQNGHWIYFSVRDDRDNGSIVDFVQNRTSDNFGQIRLRLRPWVGQGGNVERPASGLFASKVVPCSPDTEKVLKEYHKTWIPTHKPYHPYLESRSIGPEVFEMPEFKERIRISYHGNAIFPHKDLEGLCGFEIRGNQYKGFSPGGKKGLWLSQMAPEATELAFFESGVNALSFALLRAGKSRWYASTAGQWSPNTPELIKKTVMAFKGARVILSFDPDDTGHGLTEQARDLLNDSGKEIVVDMPPNGQDWNQVLETQKCAGQ
ncbi:DUF3991 and TOPRIM domain-containing protein [Cerasicoccus frondis]|uniref:DUF3991 and TOPRIM domain-containing protein n=1 Tax=Cerasicoccus frondis TaxID=490090 RepID=UPI0028529774|nr:DUF3991 and TOPRIM domain-containing protein [Cerasicoccus frondis]